METANNDLPPVPDCFRHYSLDEIAETVSGISLDTYNDLWSLLAQAEHEGKAKPSGGDGSDGKTEEPIVSDGQYDSDLVAAWPKLKPSSRDNIVSCSLLGSDGPAWELKDAALAALVAFGRRTGALVDSHELLIKLLSGVTMAFHERGEVSPEAAVTTAALIAKETYNNAKTKHPEKLPEVKSPYSLHLAGDSPTYHLVSGRIPCEENVTFVIERPPDHDRLPWEMFVEKLYYESGYELPDDWYKREPSTEESHEGAWAYCNLDVEIAGPLLSVRTMESYD